MYYKIIGPKEFKEDMPCRIWMSIGIWARNTIVAYAQHQDKTQPGKLFKVIYRPPNAPNDVAKIRMPEDWVVPIPEFKHIEKDYVEQWELVKSKNGNIMVVRR